MESAESSESIADQQQILPSASSVASKSLLDLNKQFPQGESSFSQVSAVGLAKSTVLISIANAEKVADAGGKSHISYSVAVSASVYEDLGIKLQSSASTTQIVVVGRRYSDFEALHRYLCNKYPHIIIPPIPGKHSLIDISKKDNYRIVEMRKHLLNSFLLRVLQHSILSSDPVYHRFIQPGNWTDALFTLSPSTGSNHTSSSATSSGKTILSAVGGGKKLRNPDLKFSSMEDAVEKQVSSFTFLEREDGKVLLKSSCIISEMSSTQAELGAVLNAFSLHEGNHPSLSHAIEQFGQAMDAASLASSSLALNDENFFGNHLHEFHLLSNSASHVLKIRNCKHAHYEHLGDQLDTKRISLSQLEKGESGVVVSSNSGALSSVVSGFSSISDKLQQLMDSDPETTRKTQIAKLKQAISSLEKQREDAHTELIKFSEQVSADFSQYDAQIRKDFRQLAITHAKILRNWLSKNLEAWKSAQDAISEIDHVSPIE